MGKGCGLSAVADALPALAASCGSKFFSHLTVFKVFCIPASASTISFSSCTLSQVAEKERHYLGWQAIRLGHKRKRKGRGGHRVVEPC